MLFDSVKCTIWPYADKRHKMALSEKASKKESYPNLSFHKKSPKLRMIELENLAFQIKFRPKKLSLEQHNKTWQFYNLIDLTTLFMFETNFSSFLVKIKGWILSYVRRDDHIKKV